MKFLMKLWIDEIDRQTAYHQTWLSFHCKFTTKISNKFTKEELFNFTLLMKEFCLVLQWWYSGTLTSRHWRWVPWIINTWVVQKLIVYTPNLMHLKKLESYAEICRSWWRYFLCNINWAEHVNACRDWDHYYYGRKLLSGYKGRFKFESWRIIDKGKSQPKVRWNVQRLKITFCEEFYWTDIEK